MGAAFSGVTLGAAFCFSTGAGVGTGGAAGDTASLMICAAFSVESTDLKAARKFLSTSFWASFFSSCKCSCPCPSAAAIIKIKSAGPSGAPKVIGSFKRAKARTLVFTAWERQCGIAIPPGIPVADLASRAKRSLTNLFSSARPLAAILAASAVITLSLSAPKGSSKLANIGIISFSSAMLLLFCGATLKA